MGEMYTGAKTIHTEIIISGPTSAYQTFNGADSPTQAPATTWAALALSIAEKGHRVKIVLDIRDDTIGVLLCSLADSLVGIFWTRCQRATTASLTFSEPVIKYIDNIISANGSRTWFFYITWNAVWSS